MTIASEGTDPLVVAIENAQRAVDSFGRYLDAAQALEDYIVSLVAGPCCQDEPSEQDIWDYDEQNIAVNGDLPRDILFRQGDTDPCSDCLREEYNRLKSQIQDSSILIQTAWNNCYLVCGLPDNIRTLFSSNQNPDTATWEQYNDIDFSTVVADHLISAINAGNVNQATIAALMRQAYAGDRGALAALYGLALVSAQGPNWQDFEASTGMMYYGSEGAYVRYMKTTPEGFPGGGNCATFASFAWYMAGFPTSDIWGLGGERTGYRHSDYGGWLAYAPNLPDGFFVREGTPAFTSAIALKNHLESLGLQEETYGAAGFEYNAGDLVFNYDPNDRSKDHVVIIVGWSINIPNYSPSTNNPAPPTFPNQNEATEYFRVHPEECARWNTSCDLILWGVEHGGSDPRPYARPINQLGTYTAAYSVNMEMP